jgi:hypothetical protein
MSVKRLFAMYKLLIITLIITIVLVIFILSIGGPTAMTSFVSVAGLLLAITEFFYLHIISSRHESPPSVPDQKKRFLPLDGTGKKGFRPHQGGFTSQEEEEEW